MTVVDQRPRSGRLPAQLNEITGRPTPGNLLAAVLIFVVVWAIYSIATNDRFGWGVVAQYFTSRSILLGLLRTLELTALTLVIAIPLGTVLALMRVSSNIVVAAVAYGYVWLFRGTPLLVQLIFWFNLSALYPVLGLTIPFGPTLVSADANDLITPFAAALLGLGLHGAAYMSEVIRGGLLGVDRTQVKAARALGMTRRTTFLRVVWPQALRLIIPPMGNRAISELKDTALVSVIAMPDLLYSAEIIYSRNFQTIPLLLVASIWYLIVVSVLTIGQRLLERRLGKGHTDGAI